MKHAALAITLLAMISLIACTTPPAAPTPTPAGNAAEEAAVRDLVVRFGKRLQMVSLLAPDAAQEMQVQYQGLVSPALLGAWMNDVTKAPGRAVSSPWPDRIEIATLAKEDAGRYLLTGFVIEVTSTEMVSGGSAARIPVRIAVQKYQGNWVIAEYVQGP